ncbi:GRIP and coiled-coil domain-containing protein 1 [Patella vulgata]|uniref:GRIP and coiled-coil domain-containing protein 1 n=1 Tax=Patella vulgata TaxID=6465 RepID=UPI0021801456|nr:GRIP and coiled-coil domain-containing protein 1 [Patella vulgata]XP_050407160.1 GRIP and coiled-coil domain-containing protein 1 [Patella vulgata]
MDRGTKNELLKTIDSQKEQLTRYETRLRDVVRAYKGVVKEKEALEASLKIISETSTSSQSADKTNNASESKPPVEQSGDDSFSDPLKVQSSSAQDEVNILKEQLKTLSASIATVTAEKSRLEADFVADKKKLRGEHEELQQHLATAKNEYERTVAEMNSKILELKNKIRTQQLEREKEQTDHAMMIRELQKLHSVERMAKEHFENQLDEVQASMKQQIASVPTVKEQYEKQIDNLSAQLKSVKDRLKAAEEKANQPSPMLLDLQKEMTSMKSEAHRQVEKEILRASEAETRAVQVSVQSEERVTSLETKLAELSEVVGNYERLRYQDQQAIQRLKERVTQLDIENSALARAAHSAPKSYDTDENNLDAQSLSEKIIQLKRLLLEANSRSEKPVDIDVLLCESDEERTTCQKYKEELEHVKEEFERYKLRAQSVLKTKTKDNTANKELDTLKNQVGELREKLRMAHLQLDDSEEKHKLKVESLSKTILTLEERNKHQIAEMEQEHQKAIAELELEVKKQRDRTVSMLAEKEKDLLALRSTCVQSQKLENEYSHHARESSISHEPLQKQNSEEEAVSRLLFKNSAHEETTLLHFAEEQARKNVEIASLRKQKRQLETSLRELQLAVSGKEEKLHDEIESLKEVIHKRERDITREGANLEYLKNVIYKYMISRDSLGKEKMLKAITTILQFSPKEVDTVNTVNKGWI